MHYEMQPNLPTYEAIHTVLTTVRARTNPAETHGILAGFISAGSPTAGAAWMEPILGFQQSFAQISENHWTQLLALYQTTLAEIESLDFEFQLLLPNDETPLAVRAQALTEWCQGYLIGLEMAGINFGNSLTEDCLEAVGHLKDVAILDYENIDVAEEDENAFYDLIEFVRVTVMMVHEELATQGHKKTIH